jgi:hypothetical protein
VVVVMGPDYSASVYLNGQLKETKTSTVPSFMRSGSLYLGVKSTGTENWIGDVDEVAVYNTALSAASVKSHYGAAFAIGTTLAIK